MKNNSPKSDFIKQPLQTNISGPNQNLAAYNTQSA